MDGYHVSSSLPANLAPAPMDPRLPPLLVIGATRYYLGRMSLGVQEMCDLLIAYWPHLDDAVRMVLQRDIEREFKHDDAQRKDGRGPLGADIDRSDWERVRSLWRK